jgi:serine O-acetyltransferase
MNEILKHDLYRFNGSYGWGSFVKAFLTKWEFQHVVLFRWYQSSKVKLFSRFLLRWSCLRTGIQIGYHTKIGKGLLIVHYGDIAVNNDAVIGDNCTIYHGATIGISHRGSKKGCPTLGNKVWVGANAVIVGNIQIGDDVLIAPLSYVNFDVPAHSIVIGNPGRIIPRENATEDYIVRVLEY